MRKFVGMMVAAVSTLAFAASAQASVDVYTDQAAFLAAAGSVVTEDFNNATLINGLNIVTGGTISGGLFNDSLERGLFNTSTTFSFKSSKAFGGIFDESVSDFGQGLQFYIDGTSFVSQLDRAAGSFYGFVSDSAFTSVRITAGTTPRGFAETYSLDNLQLSVGGVPEPGTWALMISGFGLAGATLRRRRAVAA